MNYISTRSSWFEFSVQHSGSSANNNKSSRNYNLCLCINFSKTISFRRHYFISPRLWWHGCARIIREQMRTKDKLAVKQKRWNNRVCLLDFSFLLRQSRSHSQNKMTQKRAQCSLKIIKFIHARVFARAPIFVFAAAVFFFFHYSFQNGFIFTITSK